MAWNNNYTAFWDDCSWGSEKIENPDCPGYLDERDYTGWLMSYGFGPRFVFLGFPWKLDFAWQYNPHKGTISDRKWYLSIGLDF